MMQSTTKSTTSLLVDIETGVVLQSPPDAVASVRYVESHPFIERVSGFVLAGPDAERVARGFGGDDVMRYEIIGDNLGFLRLRRDS